MKKFMTMSAHLLLPAFPFSLSLSYLGTQPQSTAHTLLLIYPFSTIKQTTLAISSGLPSLPTGILALSSLFPSPPSGNIVVPSMSAGATALTVTPEAASLGDR